MGVSSSTTSQLHPKYFFWSKEKLCSLWVLQKTYAIHACAHLNFSVHLEGFHNSLFFETFCATALLQIVSNLSLLSLECFIKLKPRNQIYDHIHSLYLHFLDPLLAAITTSSLFEYDSTSLAHRSVSNLARSTLQNFSSSIKPWDLLHVLCAPWSRFWSRISPSWILSGCTVQKAKGSFPLETVTW